MRRIKLILVIVSALISACPDAGATRPVKFRYGAEWGIGVNMLSAINGSYITEEGYLVESDELKHSCHANGCVYAFAGAEISRSLGIRLYSGYMQCCTDIQLHVCGGRCRVQEGLPDISRRKTWLQLQVPPVGTCRT